MGCDAFILSLIILISVSIHAPTWGATAQMLNAQVNQAVSIHAPTWGATGGKKLGLTESEVSIHAPTWGATTDGTTQTQSLRSFNPRTHMGCDVHTPTATAVRLSFQSTHPHGVRPPQLDLAHVGIDSFNPRTHMGCDPQLDLAHVGIDSFNPRTHMGCDCCNGSGGRTDFEFQSTHPHGVRLAVC